ncbi:hypothetical protein F5883DRAFT_413135 [Diaporthe sp. PMI_573]|nr:hypothetical protein F5883DRAFT_413135 [Diaporthaceae sp. PMI_573]
MAPYSGANWFVYATPGHILAAGAALPAVCILVVALRFYARMIRHSARDRRRSPFGIDDYLILPALALFSTQLLMTAAYGFIKLSIIFFYRRVFIVQKSDWINVACHVFTGVVVAWTLAYIFAVAFSCGTHWSAHWTSYAAMFEHCNGGYPIQHIVESLLITDLILDVLIVALPIPRIWSMHLSPLRKLAVTGILLLGAVATGAAAARLAIFITQIERSNDPTLDTNMSVSTVVYWSMIEAGLSLIAACLPTAQHIFRGHSVGSVVASVRSAISLPSITRSRGSGGGSGGSKGSKGSRSNKPKGQPYSGAQNTSSFRKLADSESFVGRPIATSEGQAAPGVNKTVTIEMTTQRRPEDDENETPAWSRV